MDIPSNLYVFVIVGFLAQLVDGTLGMAYGVSCNSLLLSFGIPPAIASASVHLAEIFTTFVSGLSHIRFKNVDKTLFWRLVIPGVIGGAIGAYLLASFDASVISPFINAYLIIMGAVIILKIFRKPKPRSVGRGVYALGLVGSVSDAIGGGGWGPIVTSTLIATGEDPKRTIGSVNTAEFFVTLAESIAFTTALGFFQNLWPIVGLIIGGVAGAPLAAWLCHKVPVKPLMAVVGLLIILLNVRSLLVFFGVAI